MSGELLTGTASTSNPYDDADDVSGPKVAWCLRGWAAVAWTVWAVGLFLPIAAGYPMRFAAAPADFVADTYVATVSQASPISLTTETGRYLAWQPGSDTVTAGYSYEDVAALCAGDGLVDHNGGRYRLECPSLELTDLFQQSEDGVRDPTSHLLVDAQEFPTSIAQLGVGTAARLSPFGRGDLECWLPEGFDAVEGSIIELPCTPAVSSGWFALLFFTLVPWTITVLILYSVPVWLLDRWRRRRSGVEVGRRDEVEGSVAGGR